MKPGCLGSYFWALNEDGFFHGDKSEKLEGEETRPLWANSWSQRENVLKEQTEWEEISCAKCGNFFIKQTV